MWETAGQLAATPGNASSHRSAWLCVSRQDAQDLQSFSISPSQNDYYLHDVVPYGGQQQQQKMGCLAGPLLADNDLGLAGKWHCNAGHVCLKLELFGMWRDDRA